MRKNESKRPVQAVFKRWAGKRFAVFSSLKRVIKIGMLTVVYLKFSSAGELQAQNVDHRTIQTVELESVDVLGEAVPTAYSEVARVVVSIGQKEIERAAVATVSDLLEYASNIDIRQRGTHGMQADVSIRGGSFDQVLILLNGVNITDPQTGHHNLNLPLDLSSIERIEILKGPGAWRFGPGAFSGAINIITKANTEPFVQLGAEVGSHRFHEERLSAGFSTGKLSHLLSLNRLQTDGHIDNTDFVGASAFYTGNYSQGNHHINFQAGYSDKAFGANSFYSARFPNQYEAVQTLFTSLGYQARSRHIVVEPKIYYRRNNDQFLLIRDQPHLYSNYHTSETWGSNVLSSFIYNERAVSTLGFDLRSENIWSTNLGNVTQNTIYSPVNDTILLNRFHSRAHFSVFAGHKQYLGDLTINAGINFTRHTDQGLKWLVYPGIDLSYQISKHFLINASANKAMRMPTFTDLYYQGPNNQGNPNLLPEEAIGYELGYQYKNDWLSHSISVFNSRGSNMIDWVKQNPEDKWETVNYTKLNSVGVEFALKADFEKFETVNRFLNDVSVQYTYIEQDPINQQFLSNYTLNYLKNRVDVILNHKIWRNFSAHWHYAYQHRNGTFERFVDARSVGVTAFEPFSIFDIKLSWQKKGWNVYAVANNLLDINYFDYGNVQQPGRWIKLGISKKLDFNAR